MKADKNLQLKEQNVGEVDKRKLTKVFEDDDDAEDRAGGCVRQNERRQREAVDLVSFEYR